MLSYLFTPQNTPSSLNADEIRKEFPGGIGLSGELPKETKNALAGISDIVLYDSVLSLGEASADDMAEAIREAAGYKARYFLIRAGKTCDRYADKSVFVPFLREYRAMAEEKGLKPLLTNRKTFDTESFMSSEKFLRLSKAAGVKIAHDLGFSHSQASALENYYDFEEETELLLVSDNYGREARNKPDWVTHDMMIPGDMLQPGYGTLPVVGIMKLVRRDHPDMPVFVNGSRYGGASLAQVMLETRTLFGGRVFISPCQARKGRGGDGRLII